MTQKGRFAIVYLISAWIMFIGCAEQDKRPEGVPEAAVRIPSVKRSIWQECVFESTAVVDRCTIYGSDGHVLEQGVFVPYDGGSAVRSADLRITDGGKLSGVDRIHLQNGRVLIPKARESQLKEFLDWATGKRQQP
jgi:hypothetical protein